ncbi:clathrin heavy chain [Thraustotheca clavata]|uniref:Clathrin heavy chain n=1 Tax=Thraustotheca clavata TaxID=74557 RepID=A0A1W0A3W4_9STRA|nr:clathrin heavy chain [Thraustotheca clavata]
MAADLPITFGEVLNLSTLGVNLDYVKFGTCAMESDKFITVCETVNGAANVVIIDMAAGNSVQRRPIAAEAAIMNPLTKVIALRAGSQLQIFNMELRAKMKSHQMTDPIVFWRWITPNTIGMVTATAVYHWSIEGDSPPSKQFDRHANLGPNTQIISYETSADNQWLLLVGIAAGEGGRIDGNMQLYSKDKKVSQVLQGHAGTFTTMKPPGRTDDAQVLCFAGTKGDAPLQLFIMEVGTNAAGQTFRLPPQPIPFAADAVNDFPVSMLAAPGDDIIYMITKMGYLFLFDIHTGKPVYRARVAQDTVFVTALHTASKGMLGITRRGQLLQFSINQQKLVPYVVGTLRDSQLALQLATRLNLPGAEELYFTEFNRLVGMNDVQGAARLAAVSPQGVLRTPQVIQRFQQMPAQPGQPLPVLQFFSICLELGTLNKYESIELARPVLMQGRGQLLQKWLAEDKLECSEELGDMCAQTDTTMALSVYLRANVPEKVINCFVQRGEFDKIVAYASKTNYRCDYTFMLQNLVRANPQGALDFAQKLATAENGPLVDIASVVDIFMQVSRVQETTAFLLEALKNNRPEEGPLQTRLLEINLLGGSPQVADAILSNNMFSHYDRARVAQLCEKAGLFQRALEHYTDLADLKRVVVNTHAINHEFIVTFFGTVNAEVSMELINALLGHNLRQNIQIVVQVATKYVEQLGAKQIIDMFEKYKSFDGLYYFLGSVVNFSQEPEVHFKYIEAATKMGQFKEVERVCRDSAVYDPIKVKDFLKESKLQDPRPLIHVCDRYDFVEELTQYLYSNNLLKYIEVYATKVSPQKTPQVVGKLLDLDCNEDYIKTLLSQIPQTPVDQLVEQVEKRNRLRLLQPWLEARVTQGNTEPATHNAMGKIYVTLNRDPQQFLMNNPYYEPAVVGKFCEKLDPALAFLAYQRAGGACDDDLIRVTTENSLFKDLARYLVHRQDLDLWGKVLVKTVEGEAEAPNRRALIDQVVQTALPEARNPDEVSTTVRAFMNAELPNELIELLERIVLQGTDFSTNKNLQNLLILTAIKACKEKVMDYVNRLDNFDGPEIARIAVGEQYQLYEEAFVIYKKTKFNSEAIGVLLDYINDMTRAYEFADRCNEPDVWSKLAKSQLSSNNLHDALASFIKAGDPSAYADVIATAERDGNWADLIDYLRMARKTVKEQHLDTSLIYALAKTEKYAELEEFISAPNVAQIQNTGERLFDEGMFNAAKLLFMNINNNAKLAICYVRLGKFREAVDAATKANSVGTWKEVNYACVDVNEFRLAGLCGLHIIVHPDHLEELILNYERRGHWAELLKLMEQGLGLEGAHAGIFTELAILYSKYNPSKLMEHIKIFHSRMNVSKILRACEKGLHWDHAVYLYKEDGQFDNAVRTMVDHPVAFAHDLFLDCIQKVRNQEIHYKAIQFYLEQHPLELTRLLQVLTPNLDHARVVHQLRKSDNLPLVVEYLKDVQKENLSAVNEALNEILTDDEDYQGLRDSIDSYDNFDQIALAQKVEKHELLEFRRIAAYLYKKNKRYAQSLKLSKADKMYKDAIDTASDSNDPELAEELLRFFVGAHDKECFCATLFTCYKLIKPDVAMELAWRNGYVDFVMPYMIQYVKNLHEKIKVLDERTAPKEDPTANPETLPGVDPHFAMGGGMAPVMAIAATAYNDPSAYGMQAQFGGMPQQGYGMPQAGYGMQQPMGGVGMMPPQQYGNPGQYQY